MRKTLIGAAVGLLGLLGTMLPALAGGGSCTPGLVNWYGQNPPSGAICEGNPPPPPVIRRHIQPRVYYPPQPRRRIARRAPPVVVQDDCCAARRVAPPANPCGGCNVRPVNPCDTCGGTAQRNRNIASSSGGPRCSMHGDYEGVLGYDWGDGRCHTLPPNAE